MLEQSDIRRRRHKFYWIISFGFAYFIVKGFWNALVFMYKSIHDLLSSSLKRITKTVK